MNRGGGIMNSGVRIVNLKASENSSIQTRIIKLDILICCKMEQQIDMNWGQTLKKEETIKMDIAKFDLRDLYLSKVLSVAVL